MPSPSRHVGSIRRLATAWRARNRLPHGAPPRRILALGLTALLFLGGRAAAPRAQVLEAPAAVDVRDSVRLYEQRIQDQELQLQTLRQQIRDLRSRDQQLKKEETGALEQLKVADKEVALTADLLRELETKQERLQGQLEGIRAEHARAEEILADRKSRLARTLRAMYITGTANTAEVMFRTSNLRDALTRFKYLGLLARNNEKLYVDIRQQEKYLAHTSSQLTQNLAEVSATALETQQEKRRLDEGRAVRQSALKRVRQERSEHQKSLQDLAASEKRLQSLITVLEERRESLLSMGRPQEFPDMGFRDLRGRMSWPVSGRVTTHFGLHTNPRHATQTFNSGIDIAAQEGEPVHSVARGRVEYVQWLEGYGRTIIINHGNGFYTVYAHLSEVLVGEKQEVTPGQVIARVGETGSLEGSKLHFEIRDKAVALDPMMWLGH